jgi:diguanylate cyclase (GGDEF)-like protein
MRLCLLFLSCMYALLGSPFSLAADAIRPKVTSETATQLQVGGIEYMVGHPSASFGEARTAEWEWRPLLKPNLGKQADGAWLRFSIDSEARTPHTWYLQLSWPVLNRVEVRLFYPASGRWGSPMLAGDTVPISRRPIADHRLVFPLELQGEPSAVIYMHVQAPEIIALPLSITDEAYFGVGKIRDVALVSVFFGGMLVILLYNASLMIFTRDTSYLLYLLYLLSAMFYVSVNTGFGQLFLWPEAPMVSRRFYGLSSALCFFIPLLFANRFLGIRRHGGWVWRLTQLAMLYWAVIILTILLVPELGNYLGLELAALVQCLLATVVLITLWIKGNASARLFTIAWSTLLLFTMAHILALEGLLPLNNWTINGQLIGMFTEFVLLSMALAERINFERDRRIEAQNSALLASEVLAQERESHLRAQQQTLDTQMRANEVLEARVYERTRALEDAKRGLEKVNEQLTRMSVTDALTQLSNRGHFDLMIDEEVRRAQRIKMPLSVLLLDIDHFKQVNDRYGHAVGDECLRLVAATFKQHGQRAGDLVARYGGEEFVIALPGADSRQASEQAERIRAAVAQLHPTCGDTRLDLTVSIGMATLQPPMTSTPAQLLAAADAALYRAKNNGRNQVMTAERHEIGERLPG